MTLSRLLSAVLALTVASCGGNDAEDPAPTNSNGGGSSSGGGSELVVLPPVAPGAGPTSLSTRLWSSPEFTVVAYSESTVLAFSVGSPIPIVYTGFLTSSDSGVTFSGFFRIEGQAAVAPATAAVTTAGGLSFVSPELLRPVGSAPVPQDLSIDQRAEIRAVAGTYALSNGDSLSVEPDGVVRSQVAGCRADGALVPHDSGKNLYRISVSMGGAPCGSLGAQLEGIIIPTSSGKVIGVVNPTNRSPSPNLTLVRL